MEPIGRSLNAEELSVLSVLEQDGRSAEARTSKILAMSLERDTVDVAGVLERLKRDGLVTTAGDADSGEDVWAIADQSA